jgi:uncharacterized membrane protein
VTLVAANAVLLAAHLVAASIWVGGYVAIAVVGQVARRTLEPPARIAFFRSLGRTYGVLGGASLLVGLATGAALLSGRLTSASGLAAIALGAALLVATAAGMRQARRMTRLRRHALAHAGDASLAGRLRQATRAAALLRSAIGLLTLALVLLAAAIAS